MTENRCQDRFKEMQGTEEIKQQEGLTMKGHS